MSFFHLKNLPGYQWPPLPDSIRSQAWSVYLELDRSQWLSPAELEARQLGQARALLAHCIANVPYYRELLSAADIVPGAIRSMADFRRVPVLPRRTYQEQASRFAAERLPAGTWATRAPQTSGSSGSPTTVLQTNWCHLFWCACYLRDLEWCAIDPTGTLAAIRSFGVSERGPDLMRGVFRSYWFKELDPLIESGQCHMMDIRQDHRVQMEWLREVDPDYLVSYPANLEVLAHLASQSGCLPRLRAIQSISDTLTEEVKDGISEAFGVPVHNTYSCAEAGYLASPCPAGHGLHVHAENVLLEVVDERGAPCLPGQDGRVLITSLNNLRGPFIRYDLGDIATPGPQSCPCGRGLPLLTSVQGKDSPMFHLPNGRLKSSTPVALLVRKIGGHWQHQVVQTDLDRLVVRLVTDAAWSERHAQELKQELQQYFEAPMRIDLAFCERLELPASGKFQNMICQVARV